MLREFRQLSGVVLTESAFKEALFRRQSRALQQEMLSAAAVRYAELFVRVLKGVKGGPSNVRVWSREGVGARVYFPGKVGFLAVGSDGTLSSVVRGRQTLEVSAMYPAWSRAVTKAEELYYQESDGVRERLDREIEAALVALAKRLGVSHLVGE